MRSVLLLSGGIDSYAAGRAAQAEGAALIALSIDYGQVNRRELAAAARVADALGAERHHRMVLDFGLGAFGRSALLANGDGDGYARAPDFGTYVPARHAIFLSCALALAETVDADSIVIGASGLAMGTRRSAHRDCQPEFFAAFQHMAEQALDTAREIRLLCPLMDMTKRDIVAYALEQGLDLGLSWTCHSAGAAQCGRCRTCQLRLHAFYMLGIDDPVAYEGGAAHWIDLYAAGWDAAAAGRPEPPLVAPSLRSFA